MAQFTPFVVAFDDGTVVVVVPSSRDMRVLEKAGVDIKELQPIEGSYVLTHVALQRMRRTGAIDFDPPATADELADIADLEPLEDEDPEGKGSGQGQPTG